MPFFGRKKSEDSKSKGEAEKQKEAEKKGAPPSFPTQGASSSYPNRASAAPPLGQGFTAAPPPGYGHPPPPPCYGYGYGAAQLPPPTSGGPPPYQPVQQTVNTGDMFDAGARFGVGSRPCIPPPPPGVMPTGAQVAAAQGHNVVMGQRQQTFMSGSGGAGSVIW